MRNTVVWFDIPVTDMDRAVRFYESVTQSRMQRLTLENGDETALFASQDGGVTGSLYKSPEDKPSEFGSRVYLNAEPSIDDWIERVKAAGGRIAIEKTEIPVVGGYFAYFIDSEGNRVGLNARQ
jgi:predicted enzyme related to lactoylglutathione lyase